jgi:hypothetical protein
LTRDIQNEIGEAAGKVWQVLSANGPQAVAQLKKKVGETTELLLFALGWLAREDKVEITQAKKGFRVQLK